MTTPRENLLKVFRHEIPEWIPVTGHCDPYNQPNRSGMDPALAAALGEVQWGSQATVTFSRYLGLDIMDWYGLPVRITRRNVAVAQTVQDDVTTRVWHTPKGELREVSRICRDATGAVSSNWTEHLVKGPEDLPALAAIYEDEVIGPDPDGIARARLRHELIGGDGLLLGPMDGTPLGMMYRVYSGVEALAYLWADAPAALRDCFAVMEANYLRRLNAGVQSDIDVVVSVDDTSTTVISPAMFEACNLALTDARAAAAHAAGKLYFHHSCGLIRHLLPLYRRTKMDAVHAFTIPPIGNVTVREGRRALGDRITIIAGVEQLAGPLDDRAAVRQSIHRMIREAEPWDHFILGVAGYPNRTMEQTKFVVECCREVGDDA
ncbi:MAG: uroporphyrinogen decarboxylase family protein [Planctomycetota bacterium]